MKKEKISLPVAKGKKAGQGSDPVNKFKKGASAASVDNVITSTVENVKAKAGKGLSGEGTVVSYDEER